MLRSFDGKTPRVAASAFVSEAAYVIGDVEIGEDSGIWPGAVVRGDFALIKIGRNTMVEDNCVLHRGGSLEIGDNVLIGHSVVVHGSRVGSNTLIGNNATILDDAEIGSFCVIGAGCLVSQGMKVPDGSFIVGIPAEIKGPISSRQRQGLEKWSQSYAALMKRYKQQGL